MHLQKVLQKVAPPPPAPHPSLPPLQSLVKPRGLSAKLASKQDLFLIPHNRCALPVKCVEPCFASGTTLYVKVTTRVSSAMPPCPVHAW